MKIIVACYTDLRNGGGGATVAKNIAVALKSRGYHVAMLSRADSADKTGCDEYESIPVEYFYAPSGKFWRVPSIGRSSRIAKVLARHEKPDVFVGVSVYMMNAAQKVWPDVRRVFLFPCLLMHCLKFTNPQPDFWARLDRYSIGFQERKALLNSDRIIFQSPVMLKDAMSLASFDEDKAVICPHGSVHAGRLPRATRSEMREKLSTPQNAFLMLCAGSLDANKNVGWIIESLARLKRDDVWLWIAGDGPQKAELLKKTAKLGLEKRVQFLGQRDDMPELYGAADLFIHAAWYDALPFVCSEAMSFALPVLGPENHWPKVTSSMEYMINDKRQGWLYDLENPDGLYNAMRIAIENREKLPEMGKSAQKREHIILNWNNYVNAVEGAFR
ncbi:MAG TPA: glycosyltransferase family 4 protein [Phycisphaerae bacterium]|nr:glycosyltransferase family 4 protein [Phycisphaerae bacterium]HPS52560.1 glycosyltransferase family 4 protein [Phycisphaerae bacterium]